MYCGQCGTSNPEEAGHCETCGAPLLITTGARICGQCGASIGDHDRFCTTCGASADSASPTDSYDAADDFGELDIDDIQLDELPDWLQNMAPTAEPEPPRRQAPPPSAGQPSPDDLPDWLRDMPSGDAASSASFEAPQQPPPPAQEQQAVSHQPADQFSLVSGEDLPDWLKALSDDDSSETSVGASSPAHEPLFSSAETVPTRAVANLYEVPAVSRAWQAQGRQVDQEQVSAARQEFSPLEALSVLAAGQAGNQSIWDSGAIESTTDDQETQPFSLSQEGSESDRNTLIIRIVLLVLLIIVATILGFVLIQGI